jgi:hypothetical protein
MSFDIQTARVRVGLLPGDTTKDVELTAAMDATLGIVERYCDRKFTQASESVEFIHFSGNELLLDRYPINTVSAIDADGKEITKYHVKKLDGIISIDGTLSAHVVEVDVDAGYAVLPADLEMALWMVFDALWPSLNGSGAGAAVVTGGISSISVPDVGTIRFATDSKAASTGGGLGGLVPDSAVSLLDLYRRVRC